MIGPLLGLLLAGASAENLGTAQFRAVTLTPGQVKAFVIPGLERVTGSSGACVEEATPSDAFETISVKATCGGLRTSFAWRKDGTRVHLLVCAEEDPRSKRLVALKGKVAAQLKSKLLTACGRNGQVEVHGWARSAEEKERLEKLGAKEVGRVKSYVELLPEKLER